MANIKLEKKKEPKANKFPKWLPIAVVALAVFLVLLIGGTVYFNNVQQKKAMEESYQTLVESLNVTFTTDKRLLTVEAAPAPTYSDTKYDGLKQVPDQLRNLFVSFCGDSVITVNDVDFTTVGEKQVTATITKTDRFGQTAQKQERIIITVKDTQEPQIDVVNSYVQAINEDDVDKNVLRVADPVFGYYPYSSSLENHTYNIDVSNVNFKVPGQYQAKIVINDSGNIIDRYFDVYVPKLDAAGNPIEDIVIEPTQKTEENTEESNDATAESTESTASEDESKPAESN